ncbi:MAG: WD40/YVTN/BNR-like repeat-containing protein [Persicimonas sp.]
MNTDSSVVTGRSLGRLLIIVLTAFLAVGAVGCGPSDGSDESNGNSNGDSNSNSNGDSNSNSNGDSNGDGDSVGTDASEDPELTEPEAFDDVWLHEGLSAASILATDEGTLLVGANQAEEDSDQDKGVWRSTDEGATFDTMGLEEYAVTRLVSATIDGEEHIYAFGVSQDDMGAVDRFNLALSTDDGRSWETVTDEPFTESFDSFNVTLTNEGEFYSERHYSHDGGETWEETDALLDAFEDNDQDTLSAEVKAGPDGTLYARSTAEVPDEESTAIVFVSRDDAQSWEAHELDQGEAVNTIAVSSGGEVIAGGHLGNIWRSTDKGENWERVREGEGESFVGSEDLVKDLMPGRDDELFAGHSKGILNSSDAGQSWSVEPAADVSSAQEATADRSGNVYFAKRYSTRTYLFHRSFD